MLAVNHLAPFLLPTSSPAGRKAPPCRVFTGDRSATTRLDSDDPGRTALRPHAFGASKMH
jgi:hypothetical protein